MDKPTIVIVNGTAGEGYWAAHHLLHSGRFQVRVTVRSLASPMVRRLQELVANGSRCEVVQAANHDEAALSRAFAGAHGIYGTSIYNVHARHYRPANPEERAQCHAVIGAARACATLKHFIWQTMARFELPPGDLGLEAPIHFRTKWQFEEIIKDAGLPWTFLCQPAYMRQLKFGMKFRNRLVYPYPPDTRLAFVAEQDLGKLVTAIFSDPASHLLQAVTAVSEVVTPVEIAERLHALIPAFSPKYRQASWLEIAFFNQVIVRLRPAYRYASQINANLIAGNHWAMTLRDKSRCQQLIAPLELVTLEEWMRSQFNLPSATEGSTVA